MGLVTRKVFDPSLSWTGSPGLTFRWQEFVICSVCRRYGHHSCTQHWLAGRRAQRPSNGRQTYTLMHHLVYETPGWQFIADSIFKPMLDSSEGFLPCVREVKSVVKQLVHFVHLSVCLSVCLQTSVYDWRTTFNFNWMLYFEHWRTWIEMNWNRNMQFSSTLAPNLANCAESHPEA